MEIHSVYCLLSLFRRRDKTLSGIQYKIGILSIESIFQQTNLLQWHLFSRIHIGVEIKPVARLFSYRCCGYITSIVTGVSLASKRLPLSGISTLLQYYAFKKMFRHKLCHNLCVNLIATNHCLWSMSEDPCQKVATPMFLYNKDVKRHNSTLQHVKILKLVKKKNEINCLFLQLFVKSTNSLLVSLLCCLLAELVPCACLFVHFFVFFLK